MTYNPENQYRCTIIRGKTTSADDLLPAYAHIIESVCPCPKNQFPSLFNGQLAAVMPAETVKTLNNHRTEIAGKLFGMFYIDKQDTVQISQRTQKLIADNDQPAFFKDICFKLQFPNGMDKIGKIRNDIRHKINIRQCAYVLAVLREAKKFKFIPTLNEIGYHILNSLDVLQRRVDLKDVVKIMIDRRSKKDLRRVPSGSRGTQHIRETLNYMQLANLIKIEEGSIVLNDKESRAVGYIASLWGKELDFDFRKFDLNKIEERKKMFFEWQLHYSKTTPQTEKIFNTSVRSLPGSLNDLREQGYDVSHGRDAMETGDEGEVYVFEYEKNRIKSYNPRFVNKVLLLGKTKGLGFDIQSVRADHSKQDEFSVFIEVKTTKRVTVPHITDEWNDVLSMTRNEWKAAEQNGENYWIYRVYFTPSKVVIFAIHNPFDKNEEGVIKVVPEKYRVDFTGKAGAFLNEQK